MLVEIRKHRTEIAARSGLPATEVDLLVGLLTAAIEVVPHDAYKDRMEEASARIGARDPGGVPFLALALAQGCDGIWTQNTTHFEGAGVELWSTQRVLAWTRLGHRG